ncbi:MAG: nitroreductase family protein [Candidatus Caldarchaeum sp.]|nr:nitroreductase family protein [Candidatus Caldarchaeum sp.]MDW8435475.1 nitroreductase family protein [Candidatus Caldarchaeum sp.]
MDLYEAIYTLRSIRKFKQIPVEREKIVKIIECATKAPNASFTEPWHFVVVQDENTKRKFTPMYAEAFRLYQSQRRILTEEVKKRLEKARHFAENIHEIPVMVFVFMDPSTRAVKEGFLNELTLQSMYGSVFPAIQNLMLAARGFGLGSVLTTLLNFYEEDVKKILGVPPSIRLVAMVGVGYPAVKFSEPRRSPLEKFLHWEKW